MLNFGRQNPFIFVNRGNTLFDDHMQRFFSCSFPDNIHY